MNRAGKRQTKIGRWFRGWAAALLAFVFASCHSDHRQSVLHPASPEARELAQAWWLMFWLLSAVFLIVMVLAVAAIRTRKSRDAKPPGGGTVFVVVGGAFFPGIVLLALLFLSLNTGRALRMPEGGVEIQVTGHQWWWEVRYPDKGIVTANELYIPAGKPVLLDLRAADVIHSFWVPNLHGKMDAVPGVSNRFWIQAAEAGKWRGQCAEFCGRQHALMAFWVVALPPEEFDAWVEQRQPDPPPPAEPELVRGKEAFFRASCHECHAIRGTDAAGLAGPDLTHIGSRLTLGSGTVPNNRGNLMGWIANPQEIKPGNLMPRTYLESGELTALTDYLESLE